MKSIPFIISIILLFTSCHSVKPVAPATPESGGSEKFYASKWSLREVEGLTLLPSSVGKEAYLLFFPGQVSKVSGSTGCNKLNGTFELSAGQKIKFSPLATTKMMCPPDGNKTEQRFLSALARVDNYYFSDNSLVLLKGKLIVSRLVATPADQPTGN